MEHTQNHTIRDLLQRLEEPTLGTREKRRYARQKRRSLIRLQGLKNGTILPDAFERAKEGRLYRYKLYLHKLRAQRWLPPREKIRASWKAYLAVAVVIILVAFGGAIVAVALAETIRIFHIFLF